MKIKNKGKIYPSPSSAAAAAGAGTLPAPCSRDVLSVMKLLPAAILALASVLSLEDREVLAYMITRSLNSSNLSSLNLDSSKGSKRSSKKQPSGGGGGGAHKPPVFGCDCFDCYTSYWLRWDSSPNRELIHQVIEAFEEHLTTGEASTKRAGRGKRREKLGRRLAAHPEPTAQLQDPAGPDQLLLEAETVAAATAVKAENLATVSTENEALPVTSPEAEEAATEAAEQTTSGDSSPELATAAGGSHHKGLARKVLPDVLGLLNSRLWSLWSPTV